MTAFAVDVFALQLLSIVVYIFLETEKRGCMVMLFMLLGDILLNHIIYRLKDHGILCSQGSHGLFALV